MKSDYTFLFLLIGIIMLCLFCALIYKAHGTSRRERVFINVFLVVCFSLLMAFRPDIVPDTISYRQIFNSIKTDVNYGFDFFGEAKRVEYGFLYLIKFYKLFSDDIRLFFFGVCLLSVSIFLSGVNKIVFKLMKRRICIPLVFAVYVSYFGIYYNGIAIRQGLAMAICILSFAYFLNRKYLKFLISFILAFLFHRLSFILIFIIIAYCIMRHLSMPKIGYYIIFALFLVFSVFGLGYKFNNVMFNILNNILNFIGLDAYTHYLTNYATQGSGFPIYLVFYSLIGVILTYLIGNKKKLKNLLNIYLLGILLMNLFVGSETISRGADYLSIFAILIISCLLLISTFKVYKSKNKQRLQANPNGGCSVCSRDIEVSIFKKLLIGVFILGSFLVVINIIYPNLINLNI